MDTKQVVSGPLNKEPVTIEEVLKGKEKFGERIAEKERMGVLKELIERNKESDDIVLQDLCSDEIVFSHHITSAQLHSLRTKPMESLTTTGATTKTTTTITTTSSPDLEYYYNEQKTEDKFINAVPRLDLSWLDNEDGSREQTEAHAVRSFNEDSFSSEDFHDKNFTKSSLRMEDRLSSRNGEVSKNITCPSQEKSLNAKVSAKNKGDTKPLLENNESDLKCTFTPVTVQPPNSVVKPNKTLTEIFESSQINKIDIEKGIEKKISNDSGFQETNKLTKNEKTKEELHILGNNNHNTELNEINRTPLQKPRNKTKFSMSVSKKLQKKRSDVGCQMGPLSEEENQNENSMQGEACASKQSLKETLKSSEMLDSRHTSLLIHSSTDIGKARMKMFEMEGWKEEPKRKSSVARCYCFLCGVNCGVWFC